MNETMRRRVIGNTRKHLLIYQVVIMLRSRKEFLFLCTRTSYALRVAALCDLYLLDCLELSGEVVKVVKGVENNLLKEFLNKIALVSYEPKKLVKGLNGEVKPSVTIGDFRNKIYKEMVLQNLIKKNKTLIYNKIILSNNNIWEDIFKLIIQESEEEFFSLNSIAILICLNYINGMESLLLQCNETQGRVIVKKVYEIEEQIAKKTYPQHHKLFYEFLGVLTLQNKKNLI